MMAKEKIMLMMTIILILGMIGLYMNYWQGPQPARIQKSFHPIINVNNSVLLHTRLNETRGNHSMYNRGYVLSLSYKDQIASSSNRIVSLQCWAKQWNMLVVSPFVNGTFFRGPLQKDLPTATTMKYGDIFNISKWNAYAKQQSLAPFIPWEDFLHSAPRNVILIQIVHKAYVKSRCLKSIFSSNECNFLLLRDFWSRILAPHRFRILKEVCIDLNLYTEPKHYLTLQDFNAFVWGNYSEYSPNSVSLVWNEWRGIRHNRHRDARDLMVCGVDINTPKCLSYTARSRKMAYKLLSPNSRVFHDAEAYASKYLNQSANYIAVMVRWERAGPHLQIHSTIAEQVKYWQRQNDAPGIFLATDVGKYGSNTFGLSKLVPDTVDLIGSTEELLKMLFGEPIRLEDYNRRFEDISNSTHPTYLAQLQRVIAAKARCLLMIGGGNFQQQAGNLYRELHANQSTQCFKTV